MKRYFLTAIVVGISQVIFSQITLVENYNTGTDGINIQEMQSCNSKILFSGYPSGTENEAFITTGSGITLVDINDQSEGSSNPSDFITYNNEVYFCATDGTSYSIYKVNETTNTEVKTCSWDWQNPVVHNSKVYFTHKYESDANLKIYSWDGTDKVELSNQANIASTGKFIPFGDMFLVSGNLTDDSPDAGNELLLYDPNTGATVLKDIVVGTSDCSIKEFISVGSKVYFIDGDCDLWETDGTPVGTVKVSVVNAEISNGSHFGNLFNWNGKIYCKGCKDPKESQLYCYNPAENTFTRLTDYVLTPLPDFTSPHTFDPHSFIVYNEYLYFSAYDPDDATRAKLYRISNSDILELIDAAIYSVNHLTLLNNKIYMQGEDGSTGKELYVYDPLSTSLAPVNNTKVNIYPNPTNNHINIEGLETVNSRFEIMDMKGRAVMSGNVSGNKIEHKLNRGMYVVVIYDGELTIKNKIVVE